LDVVSQIILKDNKSGLSYIPDTSEVTSAHGQKS